MKILILIICFLCAIVYVLIPGKSITILNKPKTPRPSPPKRQQGKKDA